MSVSSSRNDICDNRGSCYDKCSFFFLSMEKFIEKYVNVLLKRKTYDHKVLPLSILSCHCC